MEYIKKNWFKLFMVGVSVFMVIALSMNFSKIKRLEKNNCLLMRSQIRDFVVSETSRLVLSETAYVFGGLYDDTGETEEAVIDIIKLSYMGEDYGIITDLFDEDICKQFRVDTYED